MTTQEVVERLRVWRYFSERSEDASAVEAADRAIAALTVRTVQVLQAESNAYDIAATCVSSCGDIELAAGTLRQWAREKRQHAAFRAEGKP